MQESHHPRVIAIGETMVLVTPAEAEPLETAEVFHLDVGGAESNVASHVSALGYPAAWVGRVGDDALGRRIERLIRERGVDTSWLQIDADASTGVYFKDPGTGVHYFRGGSAASRMDRGTIEHVPLHLADFVHLSGITPALSQSCTDLVDYALHRVAQSSSLLSFDVNYRHALWDVARAAPAILAIAQQADLVFVGLDEAQALWGASTPDEVRELISKPKTLVVKDSNVGATEFSPDGHIYAPAIPTTVVEAVGAGDAFAAGYLAACLSGENPAGRLRAGHERAVLVLQSTSDYVTVA